MRWTGQDAGLRARRRQLRKQLRARRQAAGDALEQRRRALPARRAGRRRGRRRRWLWLLLLLALLLVLLRDCSCKQPPPPALADLPVGAQAAPLEVPLEVVTTAAAPAAAAGRITRRDRPTFQTPVVDPVPWLAAFRMQVSARSPRLAECFVGTARPGTLRWTSSVEVSTGRVSDSSLEPTLLTDSLTRQQRQCALYVLAEPPYSLASDQESSGQRSTPTRVGLMIEF